MSEFDIYAACHAAKRMQAKPRKSRAEQLREREARDYAADNTNVDFGQLEEKPQ